MIPERLWPGGPLFLQPEGCFKLSTDSVLLADFVRTGSARRCADLGCGAGALMVLLAARTARLHLTGIELQGEAASACRENMMLNDFGDRSEVLHMDLRRCGETLQGGSFDLVVSNPPYFAAGTGGVAPEAARAAARQEETCTLGDVCRAAGHLLKFGGSFFLVHKPERLADVLEEMRRAEIEPKRLRLVSYRADKAPALLLAEGRKNGGRGLRVEPQLILTETDGSPTAEVRRIYHMDDEGGKTR